MNSMHCFKRSGSRQQQQQQQRRQTTAAAAAAALIALINGASSTNATGSSATELAKFPGDQGFAPWALMRGITSSNLGVPSSLSNYPTRARERDTKI
jgi:hypothetical protein